MKVKEPMIGQCILFSIDLEPDMPKAAKGKETSFREEVQKLAEDTVKALSDEQRKEFTEAFEKGREQEDTFSNAILPYVRKKGCEVHPLCQLPANDGNFKSSLDKASIEDLQTALELMEKYPKGNSGRIAAIKSKLRKLGVSTITETGFTVIIKGFYDKWNQNGIEDWGSTTSAEFNDFIKDFKKVMKALTEKNGWELTVFQKGHYHLFGFVRSEDGGCAYFSYDIPRGEYPLELDMEGVNGFLVRGAENEQDYHGFTNHFCNLFGLERLFDKCLKEHKRF